MKLKFEHACWNDRLVEKGYDEDGSMTHARLYIPMVELENGARFEYVNYYQDEAQANEVVNEIIKKGYIDTDSGDWHEGNPRYGSPRHQKVGDYHLMDDEELENANSLAAKSTSFNRPKM